jgi:AbrB family looped-hinge helix DNA binding protein
MNIFKRPKLLGITKLNSKSQLVIPKEARDEIGIGPEDKVVIIKAPMFNGLVITKPEEIERHMKHMLGELSAVTKDIKKQNK